MRFLYLLTAAMAVSCNSDSQIIREIEESGLEETSGIEYIAGTKTLWAVEDSGNKNNIYGFNAEGERIAEINIKGVKNIDWEDLASDKEGNIYIGDFGNNDNLREDLSIYKISKNSLSAKAATPVSKISFYYPEQKDFPPKKSKRFFDVEAFIESNGSFYLFTKNRSAKFDGSFYIYKVPNKEGLHAAELITTLKSCAIYNRCAITGAAMSPDSKTIALLAADKIWLLTDFENDSFSHKNMQVYSLNHFSQKEGITFKDNITLLIADEKDKKTGGRLYEINLRDLKAKR